MNRTAETAAVEGMTYLEKIDHIVNHNSELELPMFAPAVSYTHLTLPTIYSV